MLTGFGLLIRVDQQEEKDVNVSGMAKETLAEKPVKYLLPATQRQIEIGFNPREDQLSLRY